MSVLVLAYAGDSLPKTTASVVGAAVRFGGDIDVLVLGSKDAGTAAAGLDKVARVWVASGTQVAPETMADTVQAHLAAHAYTHVIAAADSTGKTILPRLAALSDCQMVSEITGIVSADTVERPIYAGNAIATVQCTEKILFATVRATSFDPVGAAASPAPVAEIAIRETALPIKFMGREIVKSARPELTAARVVVSGGRGVGSADNFKLIEALADKLHGAVGASRAAVDSGYISNEYQVGQTGKVVAPELYIAVGLSGAIQHLAGMKDSKVIVAINKDAEAPIMQIADYALCADLFTAVPELTSKL